MIDWKRVIREVPDFPRPGILFRDLTPVWADPRLFEQAVREMAEPFRSREVTKVVGIEARGFIFGPAVALALGAGFVPVRKPGKLPGRSRRVDYALEYGSDALEVHEDAIGRSEPCLIVDDLLATGGTARAAVDLVRAGGGEVAGVSFFVELADLRGRRQLPDVEVGSVVKL